jgi:hypothetical protein
MQRRALTLTSLLLAAFAINLDTKKRMLYEKPSAKRAVARA